MFMQSNDTVLLVEDEAGEVALAQQAVVGLDTVNLVVVGDGVEALDWLAECIEQHRPLPALILLDLKLPKLTGVATLRRLRLDTLTRYIPIVVFSEIHEQSDVLLSYQVGANRFVNKPKTLSEFCLLLDELAGHGLVLKRNGTSGLAAH